VDIPVHRFARVASTMDEARRLITETQAPALWVVADEQTGGRGRHGRVWSSPAGNLYATLALRAPCEPASAPQLGFVAGVALHAAVTSTTGLEAPQLALKWPNDLLLDGAKLAGLLCEATTLQGDICVLIGFGLNIAHAPDGTPYPATTLSRAIHSPPARDDLLAALIAQWAQWRAVWLGEGFAAIRARWLERAHGVGGTVTVRPPSGSVTGTMRGLDADGRLLLDVAGQNVSIDAGDVFFPPSNG
jgi:BirA family biotin operon repressor/biotin-[acetyl-CoA-carboxylase] ligase